MKNLFYLFIFLAFATTTQAATYTVNNGADSGPGSLRQAILDANANPGADVIEFSGPLTITLASGLPQINTGHLIIDGTTALGYSGTPIVSIGMVSFGTVMTVNSLSSITIKGLEFDTPWDAIRILPGVENTFIYDNVLTDNRIAVFMQGVNVTATGNDFTGSGFGGSFYGFRLEATGDILLQNNTWGGANSGLEVVGDGITIHDIYDAALTKQVVIEDNSGFANYDRVCLDIRFSSDITIDNLNLTKTTGDRLGTGIYILLPSAGFVSITDCDIQSRNVAVEINGNGTVVDYTVTGNNFLNSGGSGVGVVAAFRVFSNAFTSGHVTMNSNTWGGAIGNFGMHFNNATGLIIGDENVPNADIVIEDNSGFNTYGATGGFSAGFNMQMQACTGFTVDGLDLSRTSLAGHGLLVNGGSGNSFNNLLFHQGRFGMQIDNSPNCTIDNSSFSNMTGFGGTGIIPRGSANLTVSNSNFGCIREFAINNVSSNQVIAQNNFWEVAAAPNSGSTNGAQKYNGNVDASNFLTAPSTTAPEAVDCPALEVTNTAPVANCQNIILPADTNCQADGTIDNGSYDPDGDPVTITLSPAGPYAVGTTSVTLTIDDGTETAQCISTVTVIDNEAPIISGCSSNITVGNDNGSCDAVVSWIEPTATDNCSVTLSSGSCDYDEIQGFWSGDMSEPPYGTYPFELSVDCSGLVTSNFSAFPCGGTWTYNGNNGTSYLFSEVITSGSGCASGGLYTVTPQGNDLYVTYGQGSYTNVLGTATISGTSTSSGNFSSGDVFPLGTTIITYTATDPAGNSDVCSFDVTVIDNENPVITCPSATTISPDAGTCIATNPTIGNATATDNCGNVIITNDAPAVFTLESTVVTWTADDGNGNVVTCTQTVTLNIPDYDGDGVCDEADSDDDNDGVDDVNDSEPLNEFACQDSDADGCDDCSSGTVNPSNDGTDTDGDGLCDLGDPDDDNDGIEDSCDTAPLVDNFVFNGIGGNFPTQWLCGNNNNKVLVCHVPPGNPANAQSICISPNAVSTHVGNHGGDYLGECTCIPENSFIAPPTNLHPVSHEMLDVDIFPNPANNEVNFHMHGVEKETTLNILDHLGRMVWTQSLEEDQHTLQLDLSGERFENGIYFVSFISNGQQTMKRLIVVK